MAHFIKYFSFFYNLVKDYSSIPCKMVEMAGQNFVFWPAAGCQDNWWFESYRAMDTTFTQGR